MPQQPLLMQLEVVMLTLWHKRERGTEGIGVINEELGTRLPETYKI